MTRAKAVLPRETQPVVAKTADITRNGLYHDLTTNGHHTPSMPWFLECDLGMNVTAQIMWVTPEIAREWLTNRGAKQRRIKHYHLRSMKEDILAGRFKFNGEPIIFDDQGRLIDGQHRCTAISETETPILALVVRGIPPETYSTIDICAKRGGADTMASMRITNGKDVSGAIVLLIRYERGIIGREQLVLSPPAIEEIVRKHPCLEDSARIARTVHVVRAKRAAAFCHYIFSTIDQDAANTFMSKLATGEGLEKGNPILTLRNRLISARGESLPCDTEILFMFKAWNAWCRNQTLLVMKKGDGETLPGLVRPGGAKV